MTLCTGASVHQVTLGSTTFPRLPLTCPKPPQPDRACLGLTAAAAGRRC